MDQELIGLIGNFLLNLEFAYYLITLLQWYNYSFYRVIFMHHKFMWHIWYFVLPLCVFFALHTMHLEQYCILLAIVFFIALVFWRSKQDKPLRFTKRVQRFFGLCVIFGFLDIFLSIAFKVDNLLLHAFTLVFAVLVSNIYEATLMKQYTKIAQDKLQIMTRLRIITITASFGKTSIKNYLTQILSKRFNVYATPRSVNTLRGIVADINENLDYSTEIYITEAGARLKGDIDEIVQFLHPQYVVIGEIGEQHIEYFKNIRNITNTKFEILNSLRLKRAFVFKDNALPQDLEPEKKSCMRFYPVESKNIQATLDGTNFSLKINDKWQDFQTKILGGFNVYNIAVAVSVALEFGMKIEEIVQAVNRLEQVPHRLQKITANQKLILDDSFNGNLKGMLEAIRLASLYDGRKVIVTPGIIEGSDEANKQLAKRIDEVFDIAIITGALNARIFRENIKNAQKIFLQTKDSLESMLKACTLSDDLVLFSNDAPSFI